ncbi:MAG: flagellar hook-length control protein FliK [Pseudomonadota bacterium]
MIAGLLGEHLASPRTAPKTNQNTALETTPAEPGKTSTKEGFESYVNKDADAPAEDKTAADNALAPAQADTEQSSAPPVNRRELTLANAGQAAPEGDAISAPNVDAAQSFGTSADADSAADRGHTATTTPRAEVLNDDARVAPASTDAGLEAALDPRSQTREGVKKDATLAGIDAQLRGQSNDPQTARADTPQFAAGEADSLRPGPHADRVSTDTPDAQAQQIATAQSAADTASISATPRDVATPSAEPLATLGAAASTPNAPMAVSTAGLTPTGPAIPIASPGELTGVILNALQNGADPQEQLVVQLDPPELGRIMIDFKFDAQGVQQVVVTSENPEALKRLREMHFELTEALRQQGLSDTNMSFRQEAEDRSQQGWQSPERSRQEAQLYAVEAPRTSPSAMSDDPRVRVNDRLDLLL